MELAVPYTSSVPTTAITAGRRYIYDGWSVATERVFNVGATLGSAPSTLERIYIEGPMLDEHILCAIDGDLNGALGTNLNEPLSAGGPNTNDYRYYYLPNRLGNTMALLDFNDHRRTLEYYRYTVYGEATVLPVVDVAPADGLEDTPLDLTDNNALMLAQRGPGNPGSLDPTAGRASQMNNQYTFTGRYLDTSTGLHYFRYRYYEARTGRFVQRDPLTSPRHNLYAYCMNDPTAATDRLGLVCEYQSAALANYLASEGSTVGVASEETCRRLAEWYNIVADQRAHPEGIACARALWDTMMAKGCKYSRTVTPKPARQTITDPMPDEWYESRGTTHDIAVATSGQSTSLGWAELAIPFFSNWPLVDSGLRVLGPHIPRIIIIGGVVIIIGAIIYHFVPGVKEAVDEAVRDITIPRVRRTGWCCRCKQRGTNPPSHCPKLEIHGPAATTADCARIAVASAGARGCHKPPTADVGHCQPFPCS